MESLEESKVRLGQEVGSLDEITGLKWGMNDWEILSPTYVTHNQRMAFIKS